jgi:protein TonB
MPNPSPIHRQRLIIVASVLLLHVLALWGLQSGLLQRAAALVEEIVVPVTVTTEAPAVSKPAPQPALKPLPPTRAAPPPAATPAPAFTAPSPAAPAAPQPVPQAIADPTPSANAATGVSHAQSAPAVAATPNPAPSAEGPTVEAVYLEKPNRAYPTRCLRRQEQGTVVVHVLIGADGNAVKAEIGTSSGFPCLNREALDTAMAARYKPVVRSGVAVEAWRDASFRFVLPE